MERKISGIKLETDEINETKDFIDSVGEMEKSQGNYYFHRNNLKIMLLYVVFLIAVIILLAITIIFVGEMIGNQKFRSGILDIVKENLSAIIFVGLAILGFSSLRNQ
ncbi:MAG: hypothetical protein GF347_00045 [Candidatus Moranbacteria bacterium]|nr:hypothetical protein [Candidatus Moranbacteria bacterium]